MYLKDFDTWYNQVLDYYDNNPDFQDCKDQIHSVMEDLKNTVDAYRSGTGDNYIWFKRSISAMLGYRVSKYHIQYPTGVPEPQSKYETFPELLSAWYIELPPHDQVFSKYTQTQSQSSTDSTQEEPCDHICTSTTKTDSSTGNIETVYVCLDTSKVDSLKQQVQNAPNDDVNRIFDFLKSREDLDRALYLMFTGTQPIKVDEVHLKDIAYEAKLDEVLEFYKWEIPGFNS